MLKASDFSVAVEFEDGTKVDLGADDELYISRDVRISDSSLLLNDDRLALIRALQSASRDAVDPIIPVGPVGDFLARAVPR